MALELRAQRGRRCFGGLRALEQHLPLVRMLGCRPQCRLLRLEARQAFTLRFRCHRRHARTGCHPHGWRLPRYVKVHAATAVRIIGRRHEWLELIGPRRRLAACAAAARGLRERARQPRASKIAAALVAASSHRLAARAAQRGLGRSGARRAVGSALALHLERGLELGNLLFVPLLLAGARHVEIRHLTGRLLTHLARLAYDRGEPFELSRAPLQLRTQLLL